ncbi:hypothetical protein [Kocuria kalidii]|uniref:hypothetical protein n=1 Tax=Kocuria kalidii TaxID=3376283 RepID=UPI00379E8502
MRTRSEGWVQLGLRGIFRKNTEDRTPHGDAGRSEQPADPPAGTDGGRAEDRDTGHRGADGRGPEGRGPEGHGPEQHGSEQHGPEQHGSEEPRPLPEHGPLAFLVGRLTSRGADRAVLTLVQRGNTMSHQTEQSVGDADPSVESGTVDQDSPLFDPVADLYSQAMTSPHGAWQQARIEVGPEQDGVRPVVTTYGFADGTEDVQTWRSGRPTPRADGPDGLRHDDATERPRHDEERSAPERPAPEADADGRPAGEPSAGGRHPGTTGAAAPAAEPADVSGDAAAVAPVDDASASAPAEAAPAAGPDDEPAPGSAAGETPAGRDAGEHDVPDHVDHEEWHEDVEPAAPTGAAAATAAAVAAGTAAGDEHDSSAPETAVSTDVAPSYRAPAGSADRPSHDKLAEGNLVLKEVDVLRRLADAQRRLFGEDGTAMDVSTVLVRVRALGTYYDALTHVRKNGFWDQRRTFDLIPEELLHVQELKDASYVEGNGAPLAMMFRFRPGIPPEVSFDYADEESFVRYEDRLPAQNYLEELRMYPRTGAHIPQHMNEALQDWNY